MLITFTKPKGVPVLACTRDDGTSTYSKSRHGDLFGPHDLMHYAVESVLGLTDSFFGLIAKGRSIPSFNEPGAAATLPTEAVCTEQVVNLLLIEQSGGSPADAAQFNRTLSAAINGDPVRPISDRQLTQIRQTFARLICQYHALGENERLELCFP